MTAGRENKKRTSQYMTRNLVTIQSSGVLDEAFGLMQSNKIRHLPVVDELGDVVGILSDRDLQRAMLPEHDKDSPREISFKFDPGFSVRDFMSWPVQTVTEETPILVVAQKMLEEKISAFLVEDSSGEVQGIITTDDLLRVLISLLEQGPSGAILTLKGILGEYGLPAESW